MKLSIKKRFPINKEVFVLSNEIKDFYLIKGGFREWYVKAYPNGTIDLPVTTVGYFTSKQAAMVYINLWDGWTLHDDDDDL